MVNFGSFTKRFSRMVIVVALSCLSFVRGITQAETIPLAEKPLRELFVPFDELDVLLGNDARRVYMTRDEYEDLLLRAQERPQVKLPVKVALLAANYRVEIEEGRASLQGELHIEVLDEGLHLLPLTFAGVGIRSALLDKGPAAIAKNDQGKTLLFVEGIGRHRLVVDMVMPVATDSAQQTLQFQLPSAPVRELAMTVPGNVEIKSGAEIIHRNVDLEANVTHFKLVPTTEPMSMVMSLNNRKLRDQKTVIARGVLIAEVTRSYERLYATMTMGILNGSTDEFRFAIDHDLDVHSVTCDLLSRWSVETVDGQPQLVVTLRSPTTQRVVVHVRLDRKSPVLDAWHFPQFQPIAVAGYSAVVGILSEDRLNVSAIEPQTLVAIDSTVLTNALPPSLLAAEPHAPRLTTIAAFYAPQNQYSLGAKFEIKPAQISIHGNSLVTISDQGLEVEGSFALMPQHENLYYLEFLSPENWSIEWVRNNDAQNLPFDRYPATAEDVAQFKLTDFKPTRIRVALPKGVPAHSQQQIHFQARYTPKDWLSSWSTQSVQLPRFPVLNANDQSGAVALQARDDLDVTAESIEGLLVMNADEKARFHLHDTDTTSAFRYESTTWQGMLKVTRKEPRVTAQVHSFINLQPDSLASHTEIHFDIRQARSRSVAFSLPDSTPSEIAIRGLTGSVVKEIASGLSNGQRIWRVQLAERQTGVIRLAIDFTQRLETDQPLKLDLPLARAVDVDYQSGAVAIEGAPELEIELTQHARVVDIGELVDAEYQIGKRLIGSFGYVGNNDVHVANVSRRPIYRLPTTIVERAEMVTLVSTHGLSQTAARLRLRTKALYLEARLPADAVLWSVLLDGKPALPQRQQDRLLIALPPNNQTNLRDLRLVYETPTEGILLRGEIDVKAPAFFERDDLDTKQLAIPIADLAWELVLPNNYRVASVDGQMTSSTEPLDSFSLAWLLNELWNVATSEIQHARKSRGNRRTETEIDSNAYFNTAL